MSVWHGLEWNLQVVLVCPGNLVYICAQQESRLSSLPALFGVWHSFSSTTA